MLNAVAHRDYRSQDSAFVRQWPFELEIENPGGFPEGVTAEIFWGSAAGEIGAWPRPRSVAGWSDAPARGMT